MKLNLGSGNREHIPGFINIDQGNFPNIDYNQSVADLSNFKDNSIELIYASHVLEYFDRQEAKKVLKEWRRVLMVGGILRLAVPNFPKLIKVYKQTNDILKILGPLYGRMESNGLIYHKTVYDFKSLEALLKLTGLKDIRVYDWKKTIHKDYDDHSQAYFPHLAKDTGILISLNVEATK